MQLQVSFVALLAGVFTALSSTNNAVSALPLPKRETSGIVTLPLQRAPISRDIHPQILLQQHINRSRRRIARMTGREEPSTEELTQHLERRVLSVEGPEGLQKRYNRLGVPKAKGSGSNAKSNKQKVTTNTQKATGNELFDQPGRKGQGQNGGANFGNGNRVGNQNNGNGNGAQGAGQGKGVGAQGKGQGAINGVGLGAQGKAQGKAQGAQNGNAGGNKNAGGKGAGKGAGAADGVTQGTGAAGATDGATSTPTNQAAIIDDVTEANAPAGANSLGLDIEANDVGYLAKVQIGTPPRDFLILMDSGSADLWVGAENCKSDAGGDCGDHTFLGPNSSSSFVDTGNPFSVTYGTGSVSGNIVTDNVAIANLKLPAHTFGTASTESVEFSDNTTPFDGLMGLAQSTLSNQQTLTPIEALAKQGTVNAAVIGYKISRLADNKNDGEITFGGTDAAKFDAATTVELPNVSQQGFWESAMDAVAVDGKDLALQGRTAILDTGTTLIVAPDADAQAVHDAIPGSKADGQGGFTIPCTNKASVALTFGGRSFAIDPRDLAFLPVDPNDPNGDCISGIAAGNIGGANTWLVGDVFLKNAYFSTDVENNQMTLSDLA